MTLYNQLPCANSSPGSSGWYNTDKGELFWFYDEKVWSCRNDKISDEYPKVWYNPVIINK